MWALNPDRKADSYLLQGWFTEDGLPSNKIRDIVQSRDGYLWMATGQGIVRFDGSRFTVFNDRTHPVIQSNDFFCVVEAPDGTLWFGGESGLFRWRDGRFNRFTTEDGLAQNYVRGLGLMRDGTVVAGTRRGYSFVRDGKITTPGGDWKKITGVGRTFLHCSDGTMLLGTTTGLWRASGDKLEKLSDSGKIEGNSFFSLLETADRNVWIGYSGGVQCLRTDGTTEQFGKEHGMTGTRVSALRQDRDGNVWIAASSSLYRIAHGRVEEANYAESFKGAPLQQLCEDREGGLWITTVSGLFRLKDTAMSSIGAGEGLATTFVQSVFQTTDSATWLGLWYGGVYRYDGNRATRVPELASLNVDRVFAFAEDRGGALWIGADTGLYRYAGGKMESFFSAAAEKEVQRQLAERPDSLLPSLAHPWVGALAADRTEGIWVATEIGLCHGVNGKFRVYTTADGLAGNDFESVICARNGDVWAGAPPQGVVRRHEGRWINYLCGKEISPHWPIAMYEDDEGDIWGTTRGGGLIRFHQDKWTNFTSRQGLIDDYICSILDDGLGNLWIGYPRGIMRIPRAEFNEIEAGTRTLLQPRIFNQSDGLLRGEINPAGKPNAGRLRDGRLLFATDLGVTIVDPRSVRLNSLKPPVYIERFIVNGNEVDLSQPIIVPPGRSDLQIHYTAISVLAPEKVRFKIRLDPIDADWIEHEDVRDVRYARLPAGQYTFSVKACNNDGVWNEEVRTIAFRVRPFFYQTGWFIGCGLLLVAGAAFGVIRIRARLARQRMESLEKTVELRTSELANSLSLLQRTQRQVVEASRLAGMAEIATGVLHNIGNVLNSVNVSATLVSELVRTSKGSNVRRVSDLLREHANDLPGFFTRDPRGAKVPAFLATLTEHLEQEQTEALRELEGLRKNIEHIKGIVAMQQSHAKAAGVTETIGVTELIEDAVRITDAALANHRVELVRDFQSQPVITVEKHKVMQILVNLIRNAKQACVESAQADKRVIVRLATRDDHVEVAVIDNGTGIAAENMTRIFAHGFTTRKDGHGFGLHSGALAARELGGSLSAQSDGPGRGAMFTLLLPNKSVPASA